MLILQQQVQRFTVCVCDYEAEKVAAVFWPRPFACHPRPLSNALQICDEFSACAVQRGCIRRVDEVFDKDGRIASFGFFVHAFVHNRRTMFNADDPRRKEQADDNDYGQQLAKAHASRSGVAQRSAHWPGAAGSGVAIESRLNRLLPVQRTVAPSVHCYFAFSRLPMLLAVIRVLGKASVAVRCCW
jgi:hypothetical protein